MVIDGIAMVNFTRERERERIITLVLKVASFISSFWNGLLINKKCTRICTSDFTKYTGASEFKSHLLCVACACMQPPPKQK
jgi:hypothetical protein